MTLYCILRKNGIRSELLLEYTTLENAKAYMVQYNLKKVDESHHLTHRLAVWIVE